MRPHVSRPARRRRQWSAAVACILGLSLSLLRALPSRAAPPPSSPTGQLRGAAHGTFKGRFGTLRFHADGTAQFVVLECGYLPTSPGVVRSFTDCSPDTTTGMVTVLATGYQLTRSDGTTRKFAAYLDPSGHLHLGFGAVAQLARDRTGSVDLAPGETLVVGHAGCQAVQAGQTQAVPCRFLRDHGRTVLVYPIADAIAPGRVRDAGLVYLAPSRQLVSPELVDRVYTR